MQIRGGAVYALLVAVLSPGVAPVLKTLGMTSVSSLMVAGLMYLGGALFALPLVPFAQYKAQVPLLLRDWKLYASALVGAFLAPLLFFTGLETISASTVSASLNLQQLITVMVAVLFFKEKGSRWLTAAACLMVAAGFLLTWEGGGLSSGFILLIGAFALWGWETNLLSLVSSYDTKLFIGLRSLLAAVSILTVALSTGITATLPQVGYLLACGMLFNGLVFIFFLKAIHTQGASKTAIFLGAGPFFGFLWTALFLNEHPSFQQVIAVVFLLVGFGAGWMHSKVTAKPVSA